MKLALGTVQFGLDYGISNKQGQVDKAQVADIINLAISLGIDTLDCAGAYGNSEQVLGALLNQELKQELKQNLKQSSPLNAFNIVSKIPALTHEQDSIMEFFTTSLKHLQTDKIDSLLFHHADNLLNHPKKEYLFQQVNALKKTGKINRIGVSVYTPEQLSLIAMNYPIDIAQVPMNVFDQRFMSTDIIQLCQHKKIKLHVRSLFLQGLLLLESDELPPYFAPYKNKLLAFTKLATHLNCSKLTLALAIVAQDLLCFKVNNKRKHHADIEIKSSIESEDIIEKIVVGVCSTTQLAEIVTAYQKAKELTISAQELVNLADDRLAFINPSLWKMDRR